MEYPRQPHTRLFLYTLHRSLLKIGLLEAVIFYRTYTAQAVSEGLYSVDSITINPIKLHSSVVHRAVKFKPKNKIAFCLYLKHIILPTLNIIFEKFFKPSLKNQGRNKRRSYSYCSFAQSIKYGTRRFGEVIQLLIGTLLHRDILTAR